MEKVMSIPSNKRLNYYDLLAYYRVHRHLLMYIDMWNKPWGFTSAGNLETKKK